MFQPNIFPNFNNQNNISSGLFNLALETTNTREEIERSWAAISRDIEIVDEQCKKCMARILPN